MEGQSGSNAFMVGSNPLGFSNQNNVMEKQVNERFKSLTSVSAIVDTMIQGLKKEWVEVLLASYGTTNDQGVCFGCAATNTLCQLMEQPFTPDTVGTLERRTSQVNFGIMSSQLWTFEHAIDALRRGELEWTLSHLSCIEDILPLTLPTIEEITPPSCLPALWDLSWKKDLYHYEAYRDWLIAKGL